MKQHYSNELNIVNLIEQYCSEFWKKKLKENEKLFSFNAGVKIFNEGDISENVIILNKGKVKVFSINPDGTTQIIRLTSNNQILAHRAFGRDLILPVSATTLTECELIYIPTTIFIEALKENSLFCYYFMVFFAEELKNSEQRNKLNAAKNLPQKIATAILDNLIAFGYKSNSNNLLSYTLSRKEYASFCNTTYESVVRMFKLFEEKGLIEIVGKEIRIISEKGLKDISII